MSRRQIEVCAARLGSWDRALFLRDLERAAELNRDAARLRREAWARYRSATGRSKRATP
jgi:hypothetical protein